MGLSPTVASATVSMMNLAVLASRSSDFFTPAAWKSLRHSGGI